MCTGLTVEDAIQFISSTLSSSITATYNDNNQKVTFNF